MSDPERKPAADQPQPPTQGAGEADDDKSPAEAGEAGQAPKPSSRQKRSGKQREAGERMDRQQEAKPRKGKPGKDEQRKIERRGKKRNPLDAAGNERPPFLLSFPEDPQLERLIQAFERGNYALVRREARRVAKRARDPEVRAAARELRRRIDPDPLAVYLLLAAVALLSFLTVWAYHVQ
jgi:hypothetical protein